MGQKGSVGGSRRRISVLIRLLLARDYRTSLMRMKGNCSDDLRYGQGWLRAKAAVGKPLPSPAVRRPLRTGGHRGWETAAFYRGPETAAYRGHRGQETAAYRRYCWTIAAA